jgi:flavin reductase (DIM6/NTAB) family NADH-FMN oxidoreductase RutF
MVARVSATPAAPSPDDLRAAAGRFATGVVVVTAVAADGTDHAMTANSFASVSLDPLLVLVCVERGTRFHDAVLEAGAWAVSVLPAGARESAAWFATKGRPLAGQLDRVAHRRGRVTSAAVLADSLAVLECRTWAVHPGGDHTILVGEVLGIDLPETPGEPLVFYRSRYRVLGGAPA